MKTQFNYSEIIKSVLAGDTDTLYFVTSNKSIVDRNGDIDNAYDTEVEVFFAGATELECQHVINDLVDKCEVKYADERYEFFACQCAVDEDTFAEFDAEEDDAEECITAFVSESACGDYDNAGDDSWNAQIVTYKYDSLNDCIIMYWKWESYVGYARKAIRIEYCLDANMTTQQCIERDSTAATQVTCLLTAEDVQSCSSATELAIRIERAIADMGKWANELDVDAFINDLYSDAQMSCNVYSLPTNDLKEE